MAQYPPHPVTSTTASAGAARLPCPNRECTLLSLDPSAPLVLDTRELVRRPGSQRRVSRSVPAPAELGTVVLQVPELEPVVLELRIESVLEGVLVTGTARARACGECARCLQELEVDVDVEMQELYVYPESEAKEDEAGRIVDDRIDLDPLLRDTVLLALPFRPLCREDCPGLCPTCGARLADDSAHRHDEPDDPRWAALAGWTHDTSTGTTPGPDEE